MRLTIIQSPKDPLTQNWKQLKLLASNRTLMRTALGIAFFFTLATLTQVEHQAVRRVVWLGLTEKDIGPLMLALVFGVGLGSVSGGNLVGWGRVELVIVPLGCHRSGRYVAVHLCDRPTRSTPARALLRSVPITSRSVVYVILGASAGLFDVPLESSCSTRSPPETARIIARGTPIS